MNPKIRNRKKNQGLEPSHLSTVQPSHAPSRIARTNENPTVLMPPMVRIVSAVVVRFGSFGAFGSICVGLAREYTRWKESPPMKSTVFPLVFACAAFVALPQAQQ